MAIKVPTTRAPSAPQPARSRSRVHQRRPGAKSHAIESHEAPEEEELQDQRTSPAALQQVAKRIRTLNRRRAHQWGQEDFRELEHLISELYELADQEAAAKFPGDPHARQQARNAFRLPLRSLLQTLEPPEELLEDFLRIWARCRPDDSDLSTFERRTLMNNKVRREVMNRHMEESLAEADRIATARRVEAISADEERRRQKGDGQEEPSEETRAPEPAPSNEEEKDPGPELTLMTTLKVLKRKRRTISVAQADDVAEKAFDAMRALRESVAPRWAPETQPWLVNTTDNHVFQIVLAVIPETLFKETAAWEGIQNMRAGEHAFSLRAADKLLEAAQRRKS